MKIKLSDFDLDKLTIDANEHGAFVYYQGKPDEVCLFIENKQITDLVLAYNLQKVLSRLSEVIGERK